MIRKKEKIKGQTFDKEGRLVDCETEVEEIICESVGAIMAGNILSMIIRNGLNAHGIKNFDIILSNN